MVKVKNIIDKIINSCTCGSWIDHWKAISNSPVNYCSEIGCIDRNFDGSLVQKANSTDKNIYIVPLCALHSKSPETLEIASAVLVLADKTLTCEKH